MASEEGFFDTPCCIDCSIEEYCAFPNADRVLGVDRVYEKKLVDIGEGILISEPVMVERGLRVNGYDFNVSLSHQGILAIYSKDRKHITQFTNLRDGKQVEVEVEDSSNIAFYDDRVTLLTEYKPLREARVEEVFEEHDISVFKRIGDVDEVSPNTDTSLLHSRRTLCYISTDDIPYEYNVDTRENREIKIEQRVYMFSSLMGIDCGVKAVFEEYYNESIFILNWNNKIAHLRGVREEGDHTSLLVSTTHPRDLSKGVLKYNFFFIKEGKQIEFTQPVKLDWWYSIVRVYKDVFMLYDVNIRKWVLSRVIIP